MSLTEKTCVSCEGGLPALTEAEAKAMLPQVPGWQVTDGGAWLKRSYTFKNWKQSFEFVGKLSVLAESEKHHPDVEFGWGYCRISLQTHAIGGLHENDFIMAAKINAL
ncbi:MAG: 4a-hydroxytetrahydrobiopterin dehydratase [Alphaproteobacteria bacterium]|nr:4a-hydroxytetrahydrobiopterin dehydratase [Alphaproteobacteria bacterium]